MSSYKKLVSASYNELVNSHFNDSARVILKELEEDRGSDADRQANCEMKLSNFKVYMTQKFFSTYLKGLSKYRRMAFFFLKYLFSFSRY